MTTREAQVAKKILDALHNLDGGQAHALTIHGEIGGLNFCSGAEFEAVLRIMDGKKWIVGLKTEFRGTMWSINDLGEMTRLKLQQ